MNENARQVSHMGPALSQQKIYIWSSFHLVDILTTLGNSNSDLFRVLL